jgi:predicted AlkP superfamily pyrophosphatase or phosphodiesterase
MMLSMRPRSVLLFLFLAALAAAAEPEPRLAVVISVDQLRADYLVRFRPYFGEGGFKRLLEGGAVFENAFQRHGITHTAPGHATIATGVHANVHGIVSNEWLDPASWEVVNSVEDREAPLVGIMPQEMGPLAAKASAKTGRSPRQLMAPTVGDELKQRYGAAAKIFTASNKDRSAILLGGKLANAAYWDENGRFVTSRYYRAELPAWVNAFNAERRAQAAFGKTWERLREPAIYDAVQGPDDAPGENADFGFTRTFPKKITGGAATITPAFFTAFENSPFSSELLGAFVERAVHEEQLGHHAGTDLLGVSFSQIDAIGHNYGPDSHEVMDAMLRLDRVLASLFDCIDREVGLARCVIVLSADHGVAPTPERTRALHPEIAAGRVKNSEIDVRLRAALDATFGPLPKNETWFTRDVASLHLRPSALATKNLRAADVAVVLRDALLKEPAIAAAFTRDELLAAHPEGDTLLAKMRRSYYAPLGRDVLYCVKPFFIERTLLGTTHGSPYDYDSHVPLVWFGAGIPRESHTERVGVDDLAPTLAALLGLPALPQSEGRPLFSSADKREPKAQTGPRATSPQTPAPVRTGD